MEGYRDGGEVIFLQNEQHWSEPVKKSHFEEELEMKQTESLRRKCAQGIDSLVPLMVLDARTFSYYNALQ